MWWRSEVEGVLLLPLPVCLQSRFQQCQHVLAPTGALLCCCLIEYAGCCVAAGCESRWGHLSETEEQTGSRTARRYSAGCSLPQSGVLWQLSGRVELRSPAGMEREEVVPSGRRMQAPLPPFLTAFSAEPSVKTWVQVLLG